MLRLSSVRYSAPMHGRCSRLAGVAMGCAAASVFVARAEAQTQHDPVAAQALYDDGRKLMEKKKYAEACAKFEESQRLDPGVGTHYPRSEGPRLNSSHQIISYPHSSLKKNKLYSTFLHHSSY